MSFLTSYNLLFPFTIHVRHSTLYVIYAAVILLDLNRHLKMTASRVLLLLAIVTLWLILNTPTLYCIWLNWSMFLWLYWIHFTWYTAKRVPLVFRQEHKPRPVRESYLDQNQSPWKHCEAYCPLEFAITQRQTKELIHLGSCHLSQKKSIAHLHQLPHVYRNISKCR